MAVRRLNPFTGFVGNQIRRDDTGATGVLEIGRETFHTVMEDEIPIAHNQRHAASVRHGFHRFEHVGDALAVVNCDF